MSGVKNNTDWIKDNFLACNRTKLGINEVHCCSVTRQQITENITLPLNKPELYSKGNRLSTGVLLFGMPGSGKTHLITAALNDINNVSFFRLSIYDLFSKTFQCKDGLLSDIYKVAVKEGPSVILIDDNEVVSRENHPNESCDDRRRSIRAELLELLNNELCGVQLVLCSTRPWFLDPELKKSLKLRIYVPLPTEDIRKDIIRDILSEIPNTVTDDDINKTAQMTCNPSDLLTILRCAQMEPIRCIMRATHFRLNESGKYIICDPDDPGAIKQTFTDIQDSGQIQVKDLSGEDLMAAVSLAKPSCSNEETHLMELFNSEAIK